MRLASTMLVLVCVVCVDKAWGGYKPVESRTDLAPGEIAVTAAGSFREPGKTYVPMNDISSPTSAVFLGKDMTLDLNGYTITYADGPYSRGTNTA